jgi:hypothetical protein
MDLPLTDLSSPPPAKQIYSLVSFTLINIFSISIPKEKLSKWLFWNGSLGLLHSQAPPLLIACMINISYLYYDTPLKYACSVLSIVIHVILAIS